MDWRLPATGHPLGASIERIERPEVLLRALAGTASGIYYGRLYVMINCAGLLELFPL